MSKKISCQLLTAPCGSTPASDSLAMLFDRLFPFSAAKMPAAQVSSNPLNYSK